MMFYFSEGLLQLTGNSLVHDCAEKCLCPVRECLVQSYSLGSNTHFYSTEENKLLPHPGNGVVQKLQGSDS